MTIQSASLSDRGRRANNEDFAAFFEPEDFEELKERGCLYIVADGVGGAAQGERASQFAAQKVLYEYYQPSSLQPPEHLRDIMERVNGDIHAYALDNHTRMATTMVAAIVREGMLHVANVGDSRAYLIRGGIVTQINRDHSIVGEMMAHGEMTEAEAMASKIKNRLTRSIGGEPEVTVDIYPPIPLKNGDKILLCSDGLTRYALREDIAKMTAQGANEEIAQRLVHFANESGGADNTSVVFASYQSIGESAPTIHIARPQPVDLDILVTQPGESIKKPTGKRQRSASIMVIGILSLISIVAAGVLMIVSINKAQAAVIQRQVEVAQMTGTAGANVLAGIATLQAAGTQQIIASQTALAIIQQGMTSQAGTATEAAKQPQIDLTATPIINGDSSITAINSCNTPIYVFKESLKEPINEAYISPNETFNIIGAKSGLAVFEGKSLNGYWWKTTGPFHSDEEAGWVWSQPCIKFLQGAQPITLDQLLAHFGIAIPSSSP